MPSNNSGNTNNSGRGSNYSSSSSNNNNSIRSDGGWEYTGDKGTGDAIWQGAKQGWKDFWKNPSEWP
jgi:hypothetical protein